MTRIGIISLAHGHAFSYLRSLAATAGVEIRVADPDAAPGEAGRGAAALEGTGATWADSLEDLLGWEPDGVIVCSENSRHRGYTEAALAVGAHVLCEKPIATSVADAQAMIAAAETVDRRLMIAHPVRYSDAFVRLRSAIERGDVGELLAVTGTNNGKIPGDRAWFTDPDLAGGGAVTDHTVHVADLMDALLDGDAPVAVSARSHRLLHPEAAVETAGLVQVRYAGGVVVTIDCSWSRPPDYPTWGGLTLEVVGSAGLARMDAFGTRLDGHLTGRGQAWFAYGPDMDAALIAEFLDVVRTGRRPHPDGHAGLRGAAIVAAAYESVRTGDVVTIEQVLEASRPT
ncbi:Gfo/Idh/MocA family protein [Pseudactinotalea terrae]|uniref:Gfo/Idh/MocA family protein n=1 Tax=Pseudactinotalea terrae TaxID=1743262 RepID=UPI0012E16E9B|nr:Gfo/Idh/MocA family oxidoreductase [Pseudactinotalea terrae]